jgi:hypothetical protein
LIIVIYLKAFASKDFGTAVEMLDGRFSGSDLKWKSRKRKSDSLSLPSCFASSSSSTGSTTLGGFWPH